MVKSLSLFLKNQFYRLTRKVPKRPIGYDQAMNIGILINNPNHIYNYAINEFVKELKKDGKKIEVICFINRDLNRIYEFPFIELTSKDIGWKGNFKQEKLNKFIKTEFDYLYSINILPFLPFQNIILKSRSKFRIGYYFHDQDNLRKPFDLMVGLKEGEKLDTLVKNMMTYTKKIK